MKKTLRKILRIGTIAAGLFVLALVVAALFFIFDKPLVRNLLQSQLAKRAGMTVRLGKLDYSLFPFRLTVDALEVGQETAFQKMDVSIKRLEAAGDFWKIVRGVKPALETIEADGVVFRLEQKAVSEEPLDVEAILLQASDTLAWAKRISIVNADLSISLASQKASLKNLDISLTTGNAVGEAAYSIGGCDICVMDTGGAFRLTSGLSSSGTLSLVSPFGLAAGFSFSSPRFAAGGIDDSLTGLTVETTGKFDLGLNELTISRLKLAVPGLLAIDGTAAGRFGHSVFLEAEVRARVDKLENLAAFLGPRLPAEFQSAKLRGRAELSGKYGIHRTSQETNDSLTGSLALEGVELDYALGGIPLHVKLSGRVDASGPSSAPRLVADIRSSFGRVALGALSVGGSDIHLAGTATKDAVDISRLDAAFKNLDLAGAEGKKISFDKIALSGKSRLDLGRKTVAVDPLEVRFPGIAPLFVTGRYGLEKASAAEVKIESRGLDIPALRGLVSPFIPESLAAWDLGGKADLSIEAVRPAALGESFKFSGTASLAQVRFNDPSFTIAGEGLDPVLKVEGAYDASKGISFTGALDIGQGESLWKAVYVSWNKHPLKATLAGRYDPASGGIDALVARFFVPTIGEIGLTGSVMTKPVPSFELRADARLSLGPLYSLYTQAGVAQENRMSVEGTLGAGLLVRGEGDALSVKGKLTLADTDLELPSSKTLLLGVAAELPIHYETGGAAQALPESPLPDKGFLRIGEFQSPFLTLKPVFVSLRAGANAFAIEPLALELFGGRLELGLTTFRVDAQSGALRGIGSLALREIDIARFPIQSPQFKLTGKIRADFPRLDISSREVAISGRGEADVFGGKVVLRDLSVSRPFAADRSISLNIDLLDLDLKKLTDEVPFGEVTGIVSGEVRNLVISYGQPERFDFRLESVPRKGVAQTFSLKAVDNLTVLSSGQQASGGTGGFWMSFIRGFHYQKLGLVSTLRNDTFTLNGSIHEGGVEYLVKKPTLFGISVINREPDKVISFSEMTNRLKRVGRSE
ncbi:MAG: hypothetical protein NT147_08170 [Candidatus Aminicenantes bacterium]|nr:hypothetical protein [Candidatus Aminicenantes bacterium]